MNYVAGLTWTRQPGVRFIYHPNNKVAIGVPLENPNQYIGGTQRVRRITLPAALASVVAELQSDNATTVAI